MGSQKCGIVGESQPVLNDDPSHIIFTRTRMGERGMGRGASTGMADAARCRARPPAEQAAHVVLGNQAGGAGGRAWSPPPPPFLCFLFFFFCFPFLFLILWGALLVSPAPHVVDGRWVFRRWSRPSNSTWRRSSESSPRCVYTHIHIISAVVAATSQSELWID
jgi:hypothetical protein